MKLQLLPRLGGVLTFSSMAEMVDEFAELNGLLVNMRPDDILRAMSGGEVSCDGDDG